MYPDNREGNVNKEVLDVTKKWHEKYPVMNNNVTHLWLDESGGLHGGNVPAFPIEPRES